MFAIDKNGEVFRVERIYVEGYDEPVFCDACGRDLSDHVNCAVWGIEGGSILCNDCFWEEFEEVEI